MRRLVRADLGAPNNVITDILDVPAATKFEIVGLGFGYGGASAHQVLMAFGVGTTITQFFDEVDLPAGHYSAWRNYEGVVLNPGDSLIMFSLTSGSEAVACNVHYVEVSPV